MYKSENMSKMLTNHALFNITDSREQESEDSDGHAPPESESQSEEDIAVSPAPRTPAPQKCRITLAVLPALETGRGTT